MKSVRANRLCMAICGMFIILLMASCKLTDGLKYQVGRVFGGEDEPAEINESPLSDEAKTQVDDALMMPPNEPPTPVKLSDWIPQLETLLTQKLNAEEPQVIEVDASTTLFFPPSTFSETPPPLTVSRVTNEIPPPLPGTEVLGGIDISLGDLHHLPYPMLVSMAYDPGKLNSALPAAAQIGIALFDEVSGAWVFLPTEIDEDQHLLHANIDHLSVVAIYLHTQNDAACSTAHFVIGYNKANIQNATGNMTYSGGLGSCNTTGHPDFINATADYLETAYSGYSDAGFELSEATIAVNVADLSSSYMFSPDSQFDTLTGELVIGTQSWGYPDDLRQDCAHELFHYWQYGNIGAYTYLSNMWWMDAAADYAADQVAYNTSSYGPTNAMGQDIKEDYLNDNLTSTANMHHYSTSHFIDYLIANSGGYPTFYDLWTSSVVSTSSINDLKTSIESNLYDTYAYTYKEFANYLLFDANSALPLGDTVWDTKAVRSKIIYSSDMGESHALSYVKPYASILYGLRVDEAQFMFLEWTNASEGEVYVFFNDDGDERTGIRFNKQLFATKRALFPMTEDSTVYILMTNPTSSELRFDLTYGTSLVETYSVGFQFDGSEDCISNSAWGTPTMVMQLTNGSATLHYSSQSDDYYWSSGAEHTITGSGDGTYANGQLSATANSTDILAMGSDANGSPITGTITMSASFKLEMSTDMPFTWRSTSVSGTSDVDLPKHDSFEGFACSGSVKDVSVFPAYYFPFVK